MEFITEYGLFLAKAATLVVAILLVVGGIIAMRSRYEKEQQHGHLEVEHLNKAFDDIEKTMQSAVLDHTDLKALLKKRKQEKKALKKKQQAKDKKRDGDLTKSDSPPKKRIYVLRFKGDIKASAVAALRREITAILTLANKNDEVVLCLESPGGLVHSYGLAASQLQRLRDNKIHLTVVVDKVAASGGYMMACVANKILAAPFALIGSIGVLAQLPNFHRLLKKNDIDFEQFTAGEYKRTVTLFGENTDKGRKKFTEEIEQTHDLFKTMVAEHRPKLAIDKVATGEVWYGQQALQKQLIDKLQTSDEYLMTQRKDCELYAVRYVQKKKLQQKLGLAVGSVIDTVCDKLAQRSRL